MEYAEVYNTLIDNVCAVVFIKRDNTIRWMLGTRNLQAIWCMYPENRYPLDLHDSKCSINNGLVSVFDLEKGAGRSFRIERLLGIHSINSKVFIKDKDSVFNAFDKAKKEYFIRMGVSFDNNNSNSDEGSIDINGFNCHL